ncbi:MAG: hypothetical protein FWC13_02285 [Oscillospiraceae bacterium]|nr:hypothetical protein [Oscillospiraceae bacterium]
MKKYLLVLALALLTLSLVACAEQETPAVQTQDPPAQQQEGQQPGEEIETAALFNETGLPIVNEPIRFTIAGIREAAWGEDLSQMHVFQRYQEETNVFFDFMLFTEDAWEIQKHLIAAGGDLPDAFGIGNPLTQDDILTFSSQGIIIPLRDLASRFAPRFNEIMAEYPLLLGSILSPDNEFYAFPTHFDIDFGNRSSILHVNREWVTQLRPEWTIRQSEHFEWLDENLTIEEFTEYLRDVRDAHPGSIPLTFPDSGMQALLFAHNFHDLIYVDNGVVRAGVVEDNWKAAINWAHQLYSEGLLDEEIFTHNWDMFRAKLMEQPSIVGAAFMWSGLIAVPDFSDMDDPRYANFIPIRPLVSPEGRQTWFRTPEGVAIPGGFAITSAAEHPEVLVRFIDYLYDERNSLELSFGMWGRNLIEEADGTFTQIFDEETPFEYATLNSMFITTRGMNNRVNFAPATQMPQDVAGYVVRPYQDASLTFPNFMFPEEDAREVARLRDEITEFVNRRRAEFVVNGDIDEQWESFLSDLDRMGLPRLLEIMQANFDRLQAMN